MRAKLMGAAAGAGAHSSIGSSTLGGASASTTANQFGVHPSGTLGGGATASGMSPALPLVPVTPLQQYQQGGATAVSMTLGGSDSDGTGLQMVDAQGQQLFFVQGVDGSTFGSLGTDSFMIPPGGAGPVAGAMLPHMIGAGRPVPAMPPILEATGGTPDTSAPLPKVGGSAAANGAGAAIPEEARRQ
eukprot:XP_001700043.1 predicted protein [Chlamydomonas reinhardtii]